VSRDLNKGAKIMNEPSKLPDVNEVLSMLGKFYRDMRTSVGEIVADYKAKHMGSDENKAKTTCSASSTKDDIESSATKVKKSTLKKEDKE
jgi:Sec-independent protein translocase protein TatA